MRQTLHPIALLREIRYALTTGGVMALSTPYHTGAAQAASRWRIGHHFEFLEERDDVPWISGEHERYLQVYLNHCMVGRKLPTKGPK